MKRWGTKNVGDLNFKWRRALATVTGVYFVWVFGKENKSGDVLFSYLPLTSVLTMAARMKYGVPLTKKRLGWRCIRASLDGVGRLILFAVSTVSDIFFVVSIVCDGDWMYRRSNGTNDAFFVYLNIILFKYVDW